MLTAARKLRCAPPVGASTLLGLILATCGAARGQQPADTPSSHRVVLRLSDTVLNAMLAQAIHREAPVRDNILGTEIFGRARIVAAPEVKLKECPDQATFHVVIDGTAYSRSRGYNGPAIIDSHSVTTFTATKQVVFDPGRGFYALPPEVQARTQTFVDGIGSSRGGLVGRIVRRRANREAAAHHDEAQEIARQKATVRIARVFDRVVEERLARLNRAAAFRALAVTALRPSGSPEPKYACCSTPHHLQIATNFGNGGPAIELPVKGSASTTAAPIEIWIHQSLVGERLSAVRRLFNSRPGAGELLTALAATARIIDGQSELSARLPNLLGQQALALRQVDDWIVVEIDPLRDDGAALTARNSPR